MTKQEQINKIAEEIFNSGIAIGASDLAYGLIDNDDNFHRLAKYLYAAGYRKIHEGAVVLTKEELVKMMESGYVYDTTRGNKINLIEMAREIERKETAKEILNRINEYNLDYNWDLKEEFKKLCKDYDVEVEDD